MSSWPLGLLTYGGHQGVGREEPPLDSGRNSELSSAETCGDFWPVGRQRVRRFRRRNPAARRAAISSVLSSAVSRLGSSWNMGAPVAPPTTAFPTGPAGRLADRFGGQPTPRRAASAPSLPTAGEFEMYTFGICQLKAPSVSDIRRTCPYEPANQPRAAMQTLPPRAGVL